MPSVPVSSFTDWAVELLTHLGMPPEDADHLLASLEYAESRGLKSHGYVLFPIYIDRIRNGGIRTGAQMSVVQHFGALVSVDAAAAPGSSSGVLAADLAVAAADKHGVGVAIVKNANHFGAAGYYGERIADAGMIGIVACNSDRAMCPPGGGIPVLGTNPICIALPFPRSSRPVLDMATSTVAYGKIALAARAGDEIPLGWAVDAGGYPTVSALDALKGALLPAAGHKGFGLAFMVDALLASGGARTSFEVGAARTEPTHPQGLGQLFIAMRVQESESFAASVTALVAKIRSSGVPGQASPMFPGEPELIARRENLRRHIDLPDDLYSQLIRLSNETGIGWERRE